jgi:hypothetical protein
LKIAIHFGTMGTLVLGGTLGDYESSKGDMWDPEFDF